MKIKRIRAVVIAVGLVCLYLVGCQTKETEETWKEVTVWKSALAKLQFTFPEGWSILSEDEEDQEDDFSFMSEFVAENRHTGSGISIVYEDLNRIEGGKLIRMEDYVESFQENLKRLDQYQYRCSMVSTIELQAETYYTFGADVEELKLRQQFYLRRIEDKVMVMTITLGEEDQLEDLLLFIQPMEIDEISGKS